MFNGVFTSPYWIILTPDMTVRFQTKVIFSQIEPKGLTIMGRVGQWTVRNATNDFICTEHLFRQTTIRAHFIITFGKGR